MKITKISLRQELQKAILDNLGYASWDFSTFTDDDTIAAALTVILRKLPLLKREKE